MPRDPSRTRSSLGTTLKTAPKVSDPQTQIALDTVYKELNTLTRAVSSTANLTPSIPSEGKDGDIRLYTESAADGSIGYFVQGKFGANWASGRLSFDSIDPKQQNTVSPTLVQSYTDDGGGYITNDAVTYENLDYNGDVGKLPGQVSKGPHIHDHDSPDISNTGTFTHALIDNHIGNLQSETINDDIHRLPSITDGDFQGTVSNTYSAGNGETWARDDHNHSLRTDVTYTFTTEQIIDVANGEQALTIDGDVSIDGNLTVDFSEAGTGNTDISDSLNVGMNVVFNDDSNTLVGNINSTYGLTVHGESIFYRELKIEHQPTANNPHLLLKYDSDHETEIKVEDQGLFSITADTGNIELNPYTAVIPAGNLSKDLGLINRKWRTIFAGELYVENLVAQDVMATIGGRIMVAPTTVLQANVDDTATSVQVKHNIFEQDDYIFLKTAPGGIPQIEAMKVTSGPAPTVIGDCLTVQYTINASIQDRWPDVTIDARPFFSDPHGLTHGQYVLIVDDNDAQSGDKWDGVYSIYLTDPEPSDTHANTAYDCYLALADGYEDYSQFAEFQALSLETHPYSYNVDRDEDGTGANHWYVDDAIVNLGHETGDGYLELTSTDTIHQHIGPSITLYQRNDEAAAWNDAKPVVQVGALDGYAGISGNAFGFIAGTNLTAGPSDATNPFAGVVSDMNGLRLYNSDIEIYDGAALSVYVGMDVEDRPVLALGNNLTNTIDNGSTWQGADFLFEYNTATTNYELTLSANVNITDIDYTVTEGDVMDAIDHFLPDTNNPNANGLYLTPGWLGFYETGGTYWPVKIGATASGTGGDPFFEIKDAASNPTNFIRYTVAGGVEIAGILTIQSGSTMDGTDIEDYATEDYADDVVDGYATEDYVDGEIDNIDVGGTSGQPIHILSALNDVNDGPYSYPWNNLAEGGGELYVNIKISDAEGGCHLEYTGDDGSNYTTIGNPSRTLANDSTEWYSLPFDSDATANSAIRASQSSTDGWTILALVISKGGPVDGEQYIAGEWDVITQETLTDTIIIGGGSIQIGNTNNSIIHSAGKQFNDANEGFIIGKDSSGNNKFEIADAGSDSYIKFDPTATAAAIRIKGELFADRLADVTPQIADPATASTGVYRPLSIVHQGYDGYGDAQDFNDIGDFSSHSEVVEGVRNGAIVTVHVKAHSTTAPGGHTESEWINPRIIYAKNGTNTWTGFEDRNFSGKFRIDRNTDGSDSGWREVDWVPYVAATTSEGASTSPPFYKVSNSNHGEAYSSSADGYCYEFRADATNNDVGAGGEYSGISNVKYHFDYAEANWGFLSVCHFGIWNLDAAWDEAIKMCNYQWHIKCFATTGNEMKMYILPWDTLPMGSQTEYIGKRQGTFHYGAGANNKINDSDFSGAQAKTGSWAWALQCGDRTDFSWNGTSKPKVWPMVLNNPGSGLGSDNGNWYAMNGFNDALYQNQSSCDAMKALYNTVQSGQFGNLKIGKEPYVYYNSADGGNRHFTHTYSFKVDLPELHSGGEAGKIKINFITGGPASAYSSYFEGGPVWDCIFNIEVDNGG